MNKERKQLLKFTILSIVTIITIILMMYISNKFAVSKEVTGIFTTDTYYFNPIITFIGIIIYTIFKLLFDLSFNKVKEIYNKIIQKIGLYIYYILINFVLLCIFILSIFIISGLGGIHFYSNDTLNDMHLMYMIFILPLWNILYNILRFIVIKFKNRKRKSSEEI